MASQRWRSRRDAFEQIGFGFGFGFGFGVMVVELGNDDIIVVLIEDDDVVLFSNGRGQGQLCARMSKTLSCRLPKQKPMRGEAMLHSSERVLPQAVLLPGNGWSGSSSHGQGVWMWWREHDDGGVRSVNSVRSVMPRRNIDGIR